MIYCTRVRTTGKKTLYRADDPEIRPGDKVIAEVEAGLDVATVLYRQDDESEGADKLPSIRRRASEEDIRQIDENRKTEAEGRFFCIDRIRTRDLPMKLVSTSLTFDRKKFSFYFTAEKRVDFRDLVKDLASKFRTRIELRQIGIRDEAKLVGGIGCCGREVCCKLFLTQFAPISIKMAKGQDIALNPTKISGLCGRLMCCLNYEYSESGKRGRRKEPVPQVESAPMEVEAVGAVEAESLPVDIQSEEPAEELVPTQSGPADMGVETAPPVPEKQPGERPEHPGRRSKRRRGRRGQGQKPRTEGQQTSGTPGPDSTPPPAPPAGPGQPGAGQPPGQGRRSKRRRRKKPPQEQK